MWGINGVQQLMERLQSHFTVKDKLCFKKLKSAEIGIISLVYSWEISPVETVSKAYQLAAVDKMMDVAQILNFIGYYQMVIWKLNPESFQWSSS